MKRKHYRRQFKKLWLYGCTVSCNHATMHPCSRTFLIAVLFASALLSCKNNIPEATSWIGIEIKRENASEKLFRTAGKGNAEVTWWAGGYMWQGGKFAIELTDLKTRKSVFKKIYSYGDSETGKSDLPRFQWWHAEQKGKITLQANRNYKMTIWGSNLAQPGAGWGMWLYRFGEKPLRHESPERK